MGARERFNRPWSCVELRRCTCQGDRWPDGSRIVTVGCPTHHLMPDGAPAADHEVSCMCGNFADDRRCVMFRNTEDDEEPFPVCEECIDWAKGERHLLIVEGGPDAR